MRRKKPLLELIVGTIAVIVFIMGAMGIVNAFNHAQAQIPMASREQLPINFTRYFEQNKDFQSCIGASPCTHNIEVLYQSPRTLALKSDLIDIIWKAVDFAKTQGYKVDAMSTYEITQVPTSENRVNVMVEMSR